MADRTQDLFDGVVPREVLLAQDEGDEDPAEDGGDVQGPVGLRHESVSAPAIDEGLRHHGAEHLVVVRPENVACGEAADEGDDGEDDAEDVDDGEILFGVEERLDSGRGGEKAAED